MAPHLTKIDPAPGVLFQAGNRMDILGKNIDQELLLLPAEERTPGDSPGDSPRVHGWLVAMAWKDWGIDNWLVAYLGWLDVLGCLKTNQINKAR